MEQKDFSALIKRAHDNAVKHGWHEKEMPQEHWLMMIITEISEMVEADRTEHYTKMHEFSAVTLGKTASDTVFQEAFERYIKDSVSDEMADICIRIFDMAGEFGWNLQTEDCYLFPSMTDGPMTVFAYQLCQELIVNEDFLEEDGLQSVIEDLFAYAQAKNIDLDWYIQQKMRYNELRPYKHGGKDY